MLCCIVCFLMMLSWCVVGWLGDWCFCWGEYFYLFVLSVVCGSE